MRRIGFELIIGWLLIGCVGELEGNESDYVVERSTGGDSGGGGGAGGGSGCATVSAIFADSCASSVCHDSTSPQADLDLSGANPETALLGKASVDTECSDRLLIDPSNPEQSFLLEKLESNVPQCGDPMPYGSTLPSDEIACIRQWVQSLSSGGGGGPPPDGGGSAGNSGVSDGGAL